MVNKSEVLKLVVTVAKDAHPELYAELEQRSRYYRPERIRTLATMQILGVGSGVSVTDPAQGIPGSASAPMSGSIDSTAPGETQQEALDEERHREEEKQKLAKRRSSFKADLKGAF